MTNRYPGPLTWCLNCRMKKHGRCINEHCKCDECNEVEILSTQRTIKVKKKKRKIKIIKEG